VTPKSEKRHAGIVEAAVKIGQFPAGEIEQPAPPPNDEQESAAVAERERSAQMPLMITQAQKQRLREIGHDDAAINKMTPHHAHKVLGISS
jgi:hypothetical protein